MAFTYEVNLAWEGGKKSALSCAEAGDPLSVATPKEFGGPGGFWTPEDLLVASIASCLMSTFLYFIDRAGITLRSYRTHASGRMEKTPEGLRFAAIEARISIEVENPRDAEFIRRMKDKVEKACPVSASLRCPVQVVIEV